jgi:hypothetical protein
LLLARVHIASRFHLPCSLPEAVPRVVEVKGMPIWNLRPPPARGAARDGLQ